MNPEVIANCTVNKSPTKAWEVYFDDLAKWWPSAMFTSQKTKNFIIDLKLGGLLYEDYGQGEGLVWGTIIGINKPSEVLIKGTLSKEFGGPATTIEKITFTQVDNQTLVSYNIDFVGVVDAKTRKSLSEGWQMILDKYYKPYCENL